ncbi:outer membrane protein assembly factor BamE [Lysobacter terrestris]|uniref:Outer membrane protein assembly factor BamE n=1 Tax=Agrilutibacter terrestris TaxID=2865112 RepID=A0A7H0G155_9GAMM|nr:outer membrane protein assembly factor BamE [Lysobacter terrestris]
MLALSLALSSPASAGLFSIKDGTQVSQEQFDSFAVGKTRKADVTEALGHPQRREQLGDNQVWYYDFSKLSYGRAIEEATVFEFNKSGVLVEKYRTGNGNDDKDGKSGKDKAAK